MKINVSDEAAQIIKKALIGKALFPKIVFKKAGCAGGMFVLILGALEDGDLKVHCSDNDFLVSKEVLEISDDISISTKSLLGCEIIVKNNAAKKTCRCGKSFVVEKR